MTESNEMCHDNSNKEWKPTHAETRCRSLHLLPPKNPPYPTTHEFKSVNQPRNAKCAAFAAAEATRTHMAKKKIQKRMKKLKKEAHRMPARMNLLRKSEFMK